MNIIINDLDEIRNEKEEFIKNNRELKSELNKTIFRCKLLTLENEILKNVNDHLIKIIEETIKLVKTSEAKTL